MNSEELSLPHATLEAPGDAALRYARRGLPVFPVRGKLPLTEHGFKDASANPDAVRGWWSRFPDANVALPTGSASGLLVLDVDPRHGGDESLAALEAKHACLPNTREVRTGGGGRHLFFALPKGQIIRNSAGKLGSGLDVRGENGYVVIPPSIHPETKERYAWANELKPAPPPSWLLNMLSEPQAPRASASDAIIPAGQRNDALARIAGAMRRKGCTREAIEAALLAENVRRCQPPLAESEVRAIVGSVARYAPAASAPAEWPAPDPLGDELPPVQVFDAKFIPTSVRRLVADVSERMQVPEDSPAALAIVALAACVGRRASIRPKALDDSWRVVPNLWGASIAPPGFMKSPVLHAITHPLVDIEAGWRAEYEQESEAYEVEKEVSDLKRGVWKKKFQDSYRKGVAAEDAPANPSEPPSQRRLILTDSTYESLHEILSANPAGVLVLRDELTGWIAELDKQGREGERGFFLQGWNGDGGFTVDRIGRGSIHVPAVCISLFGNIQPNRLRSYLSEAFAGGPADDGLFQRFQVIVWPDFAREWTLTDRPPSGAALAMAEKVLRVLANLSMESPVDAHFSPDAQQLFFQWLSELEGKIRADAGLSLVMTAHLSKYRSLMPSLALLFELADLAATETPITASIPVSLEHTRQAAAYCAYLESHAQRVYACVVSPEIAAARSLARHIQAGNLGGSFSARDVYLKGWSGLGSRDRVRGALDFLDDAGWVRRVELPTGTSGGRPSEVWNVNPRVLHAE